MSSATPAGLDPAPRESAQPVDEQKRLSNCPPPLPIAVALSQTEPGEATDKVQGGPIDVKRAGRFSMLRIVRPLFSN